MPKESDEKDMLIAWTEFLRDPESEKVRSIELSVKELREAKDELIKMSNNKEQRELYEMRSKIFKDKNSALNKAKQDGISEGREEGRLEGRLEGENAKAIEVARKMLGKGISVSDVSDFTGLSKEVVEKLNE